MRLLMSHGLSDGIVEVRVVKVPNHVKRTIELEDTQGEVKLGVSGTPYFVSSQFSLTQEGAALVFTYTGPQISPEKIPNGLLTIFVPRNFPGFVDLRSS